MANKKVIRTGTYRRSLDAIQAKISEDSPQAGEDMWWHIDDQVEKLEDSKFPRRRGRVRDTFELVAHPHYIVILEEDATTVTALRVIHTSQKYP